jgi:hypothetical protein
MEHPRGRGRELCVAGVWLGCVLRRRRKYEQQDIRQLQQHAVMTLPTLFARPKQLTAKEFGPGEPVVG